MVKKKRGHKQGGHHAERTVLHENLDRDYDHDREIRGRRKNNPGWDDYYQDRAMKEQLDQEKRSIGKILSSWTEVKTLPQERGLFFTLEKGVIRTQNGVLGNPSITFVPYMPDLSVDIVSVENNSTRNALGLRVEFDLDYEPNRLELPRPDVREVVGNSAIWVYNTPRSWKKAKHAIRAREPSTMVGNVAIRNIVMPRLVQSA